MRDSYEVLGEQVLQEMSGIDWGSLVSASANVAKTGIEQKQAADTKKKAQHDSEAAVAKSLAADATWANAEANAELVKGDSTAYAAAKVIRDSAQRDAEVAGAALQGDGITKRCKVAHDALNDAASAAQSATKDIAKQAKFHAWQRISDACGTAPSSLPSGGEIEKSGHGASFLDTLNVKRAGLPIWSWGLIGAGGLTALALLIRSFGRHGRRR